MHHKYTHVSVFLHSTVQFVFDTFCLETQDTSGVKPAGSDVLKSTITATKAGGAVH